MACRHSPPGVEAPRIPISHSSGRVSARAGAARRSSRLAMSPCRSPPLIPHFPVGSIGIQDAWMTSQSQRAVAHRRTPRLICRGRAADGAPESARADQIEARRLYFVDKVRARGCQARYSGYRGVPSAHIIRVCVGTVRAVEQRHILLDCCNGRRGARLSSIDIRGRRGSGCAWSIADTAWSTSRSDLLAYL